MKVIRKTIKWIIAILCIPLCYLLAAVLLSFITINRKNVSQTNTYFVYLETNGIHLNLVIPQNQLDKELVQQLVPVGLEGYYAFGWGDRNFYLQTPTWEDLTIKNSCIALFLCSPALIHVSRYSAVQSDWREIGINDDQMASLNQYVQESFDLDKNKQILELEGKGYSAFDNFYEAKGNFTCFKTCNTWVNTGLKKCNVKACLWTPFDFGLLYIHRQKK